MNGLIVLESLAINKKIYSGGGGKNYANSTGMYDRTIDLLIKSQKLRHHYPTINLCCSVDEGMIKDPSVYRILASVYDHVVVDTKMKKQIKRLKKNNRYDIIRTLPSNKIGREDPMIDNDYEYYAVKKILGSVTCDHFMFKEKDIEIQQRAHKIKTTHKGETMIGGDDFAKNKIVYEKKEDDPKLNIIVEMYGITPEDVEQYQIEYYYTLKNSQYRPFNLRPMFDGIDEYDYKEPLIRLSAYHQNTDDKNNSNYYTKLYQRNKKHFDQIDGKQVRLNTIDQIDGEDRDQIILQYLKCRPNTFIITLWKPVVESLTSESALNQIVDYLQKNGNVYYVKTEQFSKKGLRNLMIWMYDEFTFLEKMDFIENKLNRVDVTDQNNSVCFILFDNINNLKISGQASRFKEDLREKVSEYTGLDKNKYTGNDMLHINDYFYQTVEYSQMIFNKNSINMMNNQDIGIITDPQSTRSNLKMQTFRNIIYSEVSLLEANRFIMMDNAVLYSHGICQLGTVDLVVIDILPNITEHLTKIINKFFVGSSKFYFIKQLTTDDYHAMNIHMDISMKEIVQNPKYHYYHRGVKMITLELAMILKRIRNNISDYLDFLMIYLLYPKIADEYLALPEKPFNHEFVLINQKNGLIKSDPIIVSKTDDLMALLKRKYTDRQIETVRKNEIFKNVIEKNEYLTTK
jgi:hypothetical protein